MIKRMFLDIETCPNEGLFWETGYKITLTPDNITKERQIICVCWKWEGNKKLYSLDWGDEKCDKKMLQELIPELETADQIVAQNGDRFDLPWIRGRCFIHQIPCPPVFGTFDTLTAMRQKLNLNSNSLDYVSKVRGHGGKEKTEFEWWKKVMEGDTKFLQKMVKYCKIDVIQLEKLYRDLEPYTTPKMHIGVLEGKPRWTCPYCGSTKVVSNGPATTATGMVRYRMKCKGCGGYYRIPQTLRKLMLEKYNATKKSI